ncbi:MAG: hypothetical protein GY748_19235 [Planctomycetaceae bacterium]|nr:hypothetical protein [Planctomycetaceae bacterium]
MPLNNVNTEALRIVTNAAKRSVFFLEKEIEEDQYDCDIGIPDDLAEVDKARQDLELLQTSIFMMEQHLERFDNASMDK